MIGRTLLAVMLLSSGLAAAPDHAEAGTPAEDFLASDADRSGTLNAAEFRRFIALGVAAGRPRAVIIRDNNAYDMAFGREDRDRNGQLSRAELQIR